MNKPVSSSEMDPLNASIFLLSVFSEHSSKLFVLQCDGNAASEALTVVYNQIEFFSGNLSLLQIKASNFQLKVVTKN